MNHIFRFLISAVSMLTIASLSTPAGASLLEYTYTGNPLTMTSTYSQFQVSNVSIRFKVEDSYIPKNGHAVLDYSNLFFFHFSDGALAIDSSTPLNSSNQSASISFDTDADGNVIGNWVASSSYSESGYHTLISLDISSSQSGAFSKDASNYFAIMGPSTEGYSAEVNNNPGLWTRSVATVPLPGGILLFGSALGGFLCLRRRPFVSKLEDTNSIVS